jgi:methionine-rich copper-binding protein CopC
MITRATAIAVTTAALVAAAPAAAHVGVKSYSPKRGSTVSRSLERVKVTFKGRITDGHLTVRNASGTKVSIGDGSVVSRKRAVRVRLKDGLGRGRYTASMSVLHTDGHVMNKSWTFNLK